MKMQGFKLWWVALLPLVAAGCSHWSIRGHGTDASTGRFQAATNALREIKAKHAPDSHLTIFNVGVQPQGATLVLTGDVESAQAKADAVQAVKGTGAKVSDRIRLLPMQELGEQLWGISCLSVANGRELPEHKAELGTQVLMGDVVRLWKRTTNAFFTWYQAQSADGYLCWMEKGTFVPCTRAEVDAWQRAPLLVVTAFEDTILEQPQADAQPVSDVVPGDLVKPVGEQGEWFKVELPDHRVGYLPKKSAEDYQTWKASRKPTPENIERTARRFLGRPYLWGGNSPKGLDCSGFTRTVFFLNGIELKRNASHQVRQGTEVPLDKDLSQLKKGDLLFFGAPPRHGQPERITHVGLYLGDKLFIQSSARVRLSSLDPASPIADPFRIRTLLHARRILVCD